LPLTSRAAIQKTSFAGATAIFLPDNDAQAIAESLVSLGGAGVPEYVRQLVEMFRDHGYLEAAARWDAIATIMISIRQQRRSPR
jgi:hypothetical protein